MSASTITQSNVFYAVTSPTSVSLDLSGQIFPDTIEVIACINGGATGTNRTITLPSSQPTYKKFSVQNYNGVQTTIIIGTSNYVMTGPNVCLTVFYLGQNSATLAPLAVFSSSSPSTGLTFATTQVTVDPVTFLATFSNFIGLSNDPAGTPSAGVLPLISSNALLGVVAQPNSISGKTLVMNVKNGLDPFHFTIDTADAVTETNVVDNFYIVIAYNAF